MELLRNLRTVGVGTNATEQTALGINEEIKSKLGKVKVSAKIGGLGGTCDRDPKLVIELMDLRISKMAKVVNDIKRKSREELKKIKSKLKKDGRENQIKEVTEMRDKERCEIIERERLRLDTKNKLLIDMYGKCCETHKRSRSGINLPKEAHQCKTLTRHLEKLLMNLKSDPVGCLVKITDKELETVERPPSENQTCMV